MTSPFPAIQLDNVVREFHVGTHVVRALDGISLTIERGEMVAIIGPSGSGKSTLMNTLGCLDQPTSGSFVLNGQDVSNLSDNQLAETRSRQLGFVFQSYNLLPRESALSNVELPLKYSGGYSGMDRRAAARTALDRVGLSKRYDHRPMQMSGGLRSIPASSCTLPTPGMRVMRSFYRPPGQKQRTSPGQAPAKATTSPKTRAGCTNGD